MAPPSLLWLIPSSPPTALPGARNRSRLGLSPSTTKTRRGKTERKETKERYKSPTEQFQGERGGEMRVSEGVRITGKLRERTEASENHVSVLWTQVYVCVLKISGKKLILLISREWDLTLKNEDDLYLVFL